MAFVATTFFLQLVHSEKSYRSRKETRKKKDCTPKVCVCVCDMLARHGKITGVLTTGMLSELFELHIFFLLCCLLLQTSSSGCLLTFTFKADRKGRRGRKKRENKRETLMKGTFK